MHTNKLIQETSPYLLQHAHNPVNWYPWGQEALALAKQLDKPILVSIGYSACHWCHVMERESFEDERTAEIMNEHFINIKIDREERPDLDQIYMDAVQAITGSGGWPLNVFLTPDCKPFYGGTYFPPVRAHGRLSWKEVLINISRAYQEKKDEVLDQANSLTEHIQKSNLFFSKETSDDSEFTDDDAEKATIAILQNADKNWGGFGKAPKFPQTFTIQFLLKQYYFTKNEDALNQALLSLDKMIYGGIYDHVGGGFARYSTDEKWFAPHFEKMLYDNALLITVLSEAYQITKKELYKEVIDKTIQFLRREMFNSNGGYYAALDADSEGVEGKFYTWQANELKDILDEDYKLFAVFYGLEENGNWEETNILWMQNSYEEFAKTHGLEIDFLKRIIHGCNEKLLQHRSKRIRPQTDDKIILGWNALLIKAFVKAYCATLNDSYKFFAIELDDFLEKEMKKDEKTYFHTYKNGKATVSAFLDDLAYWTESKILLQEITGEENYLFQAQKLLEYCIQNYFSDNKMFYYTSSSQDDVIARKIEVYDTATPSANSVMAFNLNYLSIIFSQEKWKTIANEMFLSIKKAAIQYPNSFANWLNLEVFYRNDFKEIVILSENLTQTLPFVNQRYIPNKVLQSANFEKKYFPLLAFKEKKEKNTFYLCKNYICRKPFFFLEDFLANL